MEAETICTLFPSVKHAIFIGDPLQLRYGANVSVDFDNISLTDFVQTSGKRASSLVRDSHGDTLPLR